MNTKKTLKSKDIEKSIVQIFSDHIQVSYIQPWNIIKREKSSGTGFCIEFKDFLSSNYANNINQNHNKDKYIITNAHCVHNSSYITIRKRGVSIMYKGHIEAIIYECDLAILSIDIEFYQKSKQKKDTNKIIDEFWSDITPLEIGGIPSKLDIVYVYGYPLGGYNISITTGVVNRIQIIQYFDAISGIAIQIDAPINFGNSGGPVVDINGFVVGVAFSGEDDRFTQNMGYIIPTTLFRYFLSIIRDKNKFQGLSSLGMQYQALNNISIREFLGLKRENTGILITKIEKYGSSDGILNKMDVLTHINGKKIDNDGTMLLQDIIIDNDPKLSIKSSSELLQSGEIAPFNNFISLKKSGEKVSINILRNGESLSFNITLKAKQFLIPILEYQIKPSYYIMAGIVFIPLSLMAFLEKKHSHEYTSHLNNYFENQEFTKPDEQIIIISQIFTTELTEDYPDDNFIVHSINEIEIINLKHLYEIVQGEIKKEQYIKIKFKDTTKIIVLSSSDINKHQENIRYENIGDINEYVPS